jgi:hypothetical protein
MLTFTIEVIGDTETSYTSLTNDRKLGLRDDLQVMIQRMIADAKRQQEESEAQASDVTIIVA